jgi:hypothetical protein
MKFLLGFVTSRGEERAMPKFIDVHGGRVASRWATLPRLTPLMSNPGPVRRQVPRYWVSEGEGKIFCLTNAPDAKTAARVHREAHGLVADEIYEVQEGS